MKDSRKKVLIIFSKLQHYRIPILNILSDKYDITVLHSGKKNECPDLKFSQKIVPNFKIGPFVVLRTWLHGICHHYDVVVSSADIRYIDRTLLILNPFRKYRWVSWGIGVSASYNKEYDQDKRYDWIRLFIFKRAQSNIFYSEYPLSKYVSYGYSRSSLFVANNTTEIFYSTDTEFDKNSILFVGTLYKQKKIYDLLESYRYATKEVNGILPLNIVGDGDEYSNIRQWIKENQLEDKVNLIGSLYDQKKLEPYFRRAIACISPGQAGLSVLTSMGYGTPFITISNAITGGEIFNIDNGRTGLLYDRPEELKDIIVDISNNPSKYIQMGNEAREHYLKNRRPEQMANGISDAIEYAIKN